MMIYKPEGARVHIKAWLDRDAYFADEAMVKQLEVIANLPFVYHHVGLSADGHLGYGMPIGGIAAFDGVVVPYAVGKDVSCGVRFIRTNIIARGITRESVQELIDYIKKVVPHGVGKYHKEPQDVSGLHKFTGLIYTSVAIKAIEDKLPYYLGTLGGGNHFIELQIDTNGYLCIMIHSGSRKLGGDICDHYHKLAQKINAKWYSSVPKELAFLPTDSAEGQAYIREMEFAMVFAKLNRKLMMQKACDVLVEKFGAIEFTDELDVNHNYARMENHFGKNVMVHRKGATSAREGELGLIPGDQGSASYIVKGKGNPDSFNSCSHGAGRAMSCTAAEETLDFDEEVAKLDAKGIAHSITSKKKLAEAVSAYKNIEDVMANQTDLVDVEMELTPLGVIKG
jgi:tRNA-splicing ligase RtcB